MSRNGWGATLLGEQFDLEDWHLALRLPFDPWVERTARGFVLRSKSFDALADAAEVRDKAKPLINLLNGALALSHEARPVQFGNVAEFMADGSERQHAFAEAHCVTRSRSQAEAVVLGPDGKPLPAPLPQPSMAQRWIEVAEADDHLSDAILYYSRGDDWFDIYKCLECLFLKYGGEKQFLDLGWNSRTQIELLRRTANNERHARLKNKPIPTPMARGEARSLLGTLLRRALQENAARQPPPI